MSPTEISYTLVDAFATGPFTGNQAAVVVTEEPLSSELMQKIAAYVNMYLPRRVLYVLTSCSEFNLAETAYAVPKSLSDPSSYTLKWFTPDNEEKLCGHATLATTHVLANLPTTTSVQSFTYDSLSGPLMAERTDDGLLQLDFPADTVNVIEGAEREKIEKAAIASMHGKGSVKGVYRGNHDVAIEVVMNDGVNLADLDVDHNALVRKRPCHDDATVSYCCTRLVSRVEVSSLRQRQAMPTVRASTRASSAQDGRSSRIA
jgi:predicted PhzF superfamily epimerase YddE/YHI9